MEKSSELCIHSRTKDYSSHLTSQLKVHYETEAEVLRLLLDLEDRFRKYYHFQQCEIELQKGLIERVWLLTQRYLILISSVPGCRYPEVYTLSAEEAIVSEYEEKLEFMRNSNNSMKHAVFDLNTKVKEFYEAYRRLNKFMETPFLLGDKHHQSIESHKRMVTDIFNYFFASVLKMKSYMHQLDPINLESVEDYRELLHKESSAEELNHFLMQSFVYCKCLRPAQTCPIVKLKCVRENIDSLNHISRV